MGRVSRAQWTTNYGMFSYNKENRNLDLSGRKRQKLRLSLQEYGWLPSFPMMCRKEHGKLKVVDGQHRLAIATELNIPVLYVVDDTQIDLAFLSDTSKSWDIGDYAQRYAAKGNQHYVELVEFQAQHRLPLSQCVGILGDNTTERNLMEAFKSGNFRVRSRDVANRVATLYAQIGQHNPKIKTRFFIAALFAVCQVPGLQDTRFVHGAARVHEALVPYASRDGYLTMLETLYNYGRRVKEPIKIAAENAIRERNPANKSSKHKKAA